MAESNLKPSLFSSTLFWLLIFVAAGACLLFLVPTTELDRKVITRTIGLGLCASLIAIPLGAAIAWVCQSSGWISHILFVVCAALLLVPMFIHVSSWDAAFGKLGWLTATQGKALSPLVSGWIAGSWIHGIAAAPQVAMILMIGLASSRRVYEEQALMDTSSWGVFWNVTIWNLFPLLLLAVVWIVVTCAREIAVTDLYQIGTLAEQIYLGYSLGLNSIQGNWSPEQLAEAGSLGTGLTVAVIGWIALLGLFLFMQLTRMELNANELLIQLKPPAGTKRKVTGIALLILLLAIPLSNVVTRACFFVKPINGIPTQGYSLNQMLRAINRSVVDYQDEFTWSFLIALTSSILILILAICLASLARRAKTLQFLLALILAVSCAIPGPYIGTLTGDVFLWFDGEFINWLYNYTIAAPVVANVIFCFPVGVLLVWFLLRKTPQDAIESSSIEGANALTSLFRIGLAANWMSVAGIFLITFAFCFGELSASQIVRPAGMDTVPRKMLGDLHAGVNELTAGITIVMTTTIVVISLVGWAFIRLNQLNDTRK